MVYFYKVMTVILLNTTKLRLKLLYKFNTNWTNYTLLILSSLTFHINFTNICLLLQSFILLTFYPLNYSFKNYSLSSSKTFIRAILLGYLAANVFTTLSQSILVSLYAARMQSALSLSSVWLVLLKDFTLFRAEILLSQAHVVTGNVSKILKIVCILGKHLFAWSL